MANSINYASIPVVGAATLSVGDASRSNPVQVGTIFNSAAGGQVERIAIMPLGSTTATRISIFRYDGANYHLYAEVAMPAITSSASLPNQGLTLQAVDYPNLFPILVPSGWQLRATVADNQAAGIKVQAEGGGY